MSKYILGSLAVMCFTSLAWAGPCDPRIESCEETPNEYRLVSKVDFNAKDLQVVMEYDSVSLVHNGSGEVLESFAGYFLQSSMNEQFIEIGQMLVKARVLNAPVSVAKYDAFYNKNTFYTDTYLDKNDGPWGTFKNAVIDTSYSKFLRTVEKIEMSEGNVESIKIQDFDQIACKSGAGSKVVKFVTYQGIPILLSKQTPDCSSMVESARKNKKSIEVNFKLQILKVSE